MAYKMRGSELYGKMKLDRNMDDTSTPEGRGKSSMAQYNKKGAPNYKNPQDYKVFNMGNKPEADEFSGAPMLKGNQHKIDKNKDGKISKADFDMMNKKGAPKRKEGIYNKDLGDIKDKKARLEESKKRSASHKKFREANPGMFKKDKDGMFRDKDGRTVREANIAEQRRSLQRMDKEGAKAMKRGRKAFEESQKPGAPGVKDVIKKGKKVAKKVVSKVKKSRAYKGAKEVGKGFKIIGQTIANPVQSIKSDIKEYKRRKAAEKK